MDEQARLEIVCACKGTKGSNPFLSANHPPILISHDSRMCDSCRHTQNQYELGSASSRQGHYGYHDEQNGESHPGIDKSLR